MDEDKIEELISYLAKKGFKGGQLEADVRRNINQGMPYFSVRHTIDYGKEQMFYDLRFRRDHQFDAYRLEGYKATHRKPVKIDHQIINGIDTAALEERLKEIDWNAHFNRSEKYPGNPKDTEIAKTISDLLELDANQNQEGIKIQELLQFKYLPEQYYDERLKELRSQYDLSSEFTATESGLCNANLAYHSVSGKLDDLYEMLQSLELNQYPGMDVYAKLETILSGNPDAFELKRFRNEPEGYAEYVVPVTKIDSDYFTDNYTVSLTPYPPIEHGVYNGIDTLKLETMMRKIDWHNDRELFILHEDKEPEFLPQVAIIQEQMYRLSQDTVGGDIADKLQLRYWADASFFEGMVQQTAWDYLESLPKRVQQFPVEINAKTAFNLLCGRAALNTPLDNALSERDDWIRLDLSQKDAEKNYAIQHINSFSKTELESILNLLPVGPLEYYPLKNALLRGDLAPVKLTNRSSVLMEANPENKTVNIYSSDLHPIYTNIRLDPEWRPPFSKQEKASEMLSQKPQKTKLNSFSKPNKKKHRKGRRM